MDNATMHKLPDKVLEKYPHIRVYFLSANRTAILQPMDQGVIWSFKSRYVKLLMGQVYEVRRLGCIVCLNVFMSCIYIQQACVSNALIRYVTCYVMKL